MKGQGTESSDIKVAAMDADGTITPLVEAPTVALGCIMRQNSLDARQAIGQAAANEAFLLELESSGGSLLLLRPNGKLYHVDQFEAGE